MIAWVLEQEKAIADKKHSHLNPSWQDIDLLESVHKAQNPRVDVLSGESYVSVSCVKPVLQLFNEGVLMSEDDDTELTKGTKTAITTYLNDKFNDAHHRWSSEHGDPC